MFVRYALAALILFAGSAAGAAERPMHAVDRAALAAQVKTEFLHAWRGYRQFAWGHDDLAPLTRKPHDWYARPLLMTPVDALDTLVLMELDEEANAARELIATTLDVDQDIYVK